MPKQKNIWVVVMDGAQARFFRFDPKTPALVPVPPGSLQSAASRGPGRDLSSDRPGRSFSSAGGGVRHAFEQEHDFRKAEKHAFTAQVVEVLHQACAQEAFDELVLVAPPRSMGELRGLLSKRVLALLRQEIPKDLINDTPAELLAILSSALRGPVHRPSR